jgi:uncharacterized membrane protein
VVVLATVVTLAYPFLAALAVRRFGPAWVVLALVTLLVLRIVFGRGKAVPLAATVAMAVAAAALGVVALVDTNLSVRLYPVFMNAAALAAFGATLVRPPSMIERLARLHEPDLPESGVRYTRVVTFVWCGFFLLNGAIALWTAVAGSWQVWTLYNGLIAYIGMGLLLGGEWVVRRFVRPKAAGKV